MPAKKSQNRKVLRIAKYLPSFLLPAFDFEIWLWNSVFDEHFLIGTAIGSRVLHVPGALDLGSLQLSAVSRAQTMQGAGHEKVEGWILSSYMH